MLTTEQLSTIQIQLSVCLEEEQKLTDWEKSFIDSISDQLTHYNHLSERQLEVLKKVYDRVV